MTNYQIHANIPAEKYLASLYRYHQVVRQIVASNDLADGFFYGNPQYKFPYLPSPGILKNERRHYHGAMLQLYRAMSNEYELLHNSDFDTLPAGNRKLLTQKVMKQYEKAQELLNVIKLIMVE